MIVKFRSGKAWVVFGEVDRVEHRLSDFDPTQNVVGGGTLLYDPPDNQPAFNRVELSFFGKNKVEVIACTPIYLMNDQGKTVEII